MGAIKNRVHPMVRLSANLVLAAGFGASATALGYQEVTHEYCPAAMVGEAFGCSSGKLLEDAFLPIGKLAIGMPAYDRGLRDKQVPGIPLSAATLGFIYFGTHAVMNVFEHQRRGRSQSGHM